MNETIIAHRFQQREPLHAGGRLSVHRARDVASETSGLLLSLRGRRFEAAESVLRLRLRLFEEHAPFRSFAPRAVLWSEGTLHLFLIGETGQPWADWLRTLPPAAARAEAAGLWESLESLRRSGLVAGGLTVEALRRDADGPFFLPSAYAASDDLLEGGREGFPWGEPARCRGEHLELRRSLLELLVERGLSEDDAERALPVPEPVPEPPGAETLRDRLDGLAERGGCLSIACGGRLSAPLRETVERWSQETDRRLLLLRPHAAPSQVAKREEDDEAGAVLLLESFDSYAAFAESLARLGGAGWIDGQEILILVREGGAPDGATQLYLASLEHRYETGVIEESFDALPRSSPPAQRANGLAARVLEALHFERRPLGESLLRRAFSLSTEEFVALAHELYRDGCVELLVGRTELTPGLPQLLLDATGDAPPRDATRGEEVARLLASTLEGTRGRGGLGRAWLRMRAALVTDPRRAVPLARKLVDRAQRQGLPLLEYSVWAELMAHADVAAPSLEDRCRAAICMGEQHRVQGSLDRAGEIFTAGVEDLEAAGETAGATLAPLAAEFALKRASLAQHRGQYHEAEALLSAALERYKDELPALSRGRIYLDLSWALLQLGRTREAASHCELTLGILDAERQPHEVARAYNLLGIAYFRESNYAQSLVNLQRCIVLREQLDDSLGVARGYNNLALTYRSLGRLSDAERCLRRSLELKTRLGDGLGVAGGLLNLGYVALDQGKHAEVRRCANECLRMAVQLKHAEMEAEAHGLLGEAAMGEGQFEDARELLSKDLEICRLIGHETELLATLRRFVALLLELGELDEAARQLEEARRALGRLPSRFEGAMLDSLEAQLLARTEAREPAIDAFGAAARTFASLRRFDLQLDCLARKGLVEQELGWRGRARGTLVEARSLIARHEIHKVPDALGRLESAVGVEGSVEPEVLGPERCLGVLAELLGPAGGLEDGKPESALRALLAGLAGEGLHWLRNPAERSLSLVHGRLGQGEVPEKLRERLGAAAGDDEADPLREEGWTAVRTRGAEPGWLVLLRDRALEESEVSFLQSIAGLLGLTVGGGLPESAETALERDVEQAPPEQRYGIVGRSEGIRRVLQTVETVSDNDVTILLLGENGTGKDLVAQAIHRASPRRGHAFLAVNCASIPPTLLESELFGHEKGAFTSAYDQRQGMFERAHGGVIFLDEIGEMPLPMQAKLLRVLQDKSFTRVGGTRTIQTDVRVIAATNRDLSQEVRQGRFRMDLFYRLNVISIDIPPLRDRIDDIELLVRHFLGRFAGEFSSPVREISQEALARLKEYRWPGNVRELENVVKNAMVFASGRVLRLEDLPPLLLHDGAERSAPSVEEAVRVMIEAEGYDEDRPLMPRLELLLAHEAVRRTGNKTRAAQCLGITKPTLYNRLRRYEALYGSGAEGGDASGESR